MKRSNLSLVPKKRSLFYLFIFLLFWVSNLPVRSLIKSNLANKNIDLIDNNYLKNVPLQDYKVGPGDTLQIKISRMHPELESKVTVDGVGTIYVPRLKRIYVENLTINELANLLNDSYQEFIINPSVEVTVLAYRPIKIYLKGEIQQPGVKVLRGSMKAFDTYEENTNNRENNNSFGSNYFPTVFDAIRAGGGITQYSDLSKIRIIRKNSLSEGGGKITTIIDFQDFLRSGDSEVNLRIYDSDIIEVGYSNVSNNINLSKAISSGLNPRFVKVFVFGRVNNPGEIKLSSASVLSDAVDMAGGAKFVRGQLKFIRLKNDGSIDKRSFKYKSSRKRNTYKNPTLKNGDLIIVGESPVSVANSVITEFTSPLVGIFSTYGIIKAIQD